MPRFPNRPVQTPVHAMTKEERDYACYALNSTGWYKKEMPRATPENLHMFDPAILLVCMVFKQELPMEWWEYLEGDELHLYMIANKILEYTWPETVHDAWPPVVPGAPMNPPTDAQLDKIVVA